MNLGKGSWFGVGWTKRFGVPGGRFRHIRKVFLYEAVFDSVNELS